MNPRFSIVITTFNRSKLLVRALHSLTEQTFSDWEAIVVDDGSTDNTQTVVESLIENHKNIHYVRQKNQGEAGAKNKGISICRGAYISFLDSDDEYRPEHLESRNEILVKNPDVQLLHGGVLIIGDEYVPDRKNPEKMIHLSDCIVGGTFFIKNEVIRSLGGFKNISIGTDSELFERAAGKGLKILKTNLPTYIYQRTSQDSITHKFQNKSMKL